MDSEVEDLLLPVSEDLLFRQNEAPPLFHKEVTGFLNSTFPEKWIHREVPVLWPPLSPVLDYFFWGYIKEAVYVPSLATTFPEFAGGTRDIMTHTPLTCQMHLVFVPMSFSS
jgi:hypothetical protein